MVTRDGFVKILDFGLAKLVRPASIPARDGALTVTRRNRGRDGPGHRRVHVARAGERGARWTSARTSSPSARSSTRWRRAGAPSSVRLPRRRCRRSSSPSPSRCTRSRRRPRRTSPGSSSAVWRRTPRIATDRPRTWRGISRPCATIPRGARQPGVAPPGRRRLRLSRTALAATALAVVGLAALTYFAGQRVQARRDREAPPPKRTTLTFRRGYLTGARFAPDGQTIVYSACWDGKRSEIFTTRVGSTESRPLGIENAGILAVSSTGEMAISIDCISGIPCMGMLARVPLAGGAPREILGGVVSADWSPDGKDLAVGARGTIQYPIGKVLYQAEIRGFVSSLRVSPDGNLVAFLDHPSRESERAILSVVDRAGKKKILTNEWARAGPILWSPAGDEVFFTRWGRRRKARSASFGGHAERRVDSGARRCLARRAVSRHRHAVRELPRGHSCARSGRARGAQPLLARALRRRRPLRRREAAPPLRGREQSRTSRRRSSRPTCAPPTARTR